MAAEQYGSRAPSAIRLAIVAGAAGNVMEWYDWGVYGFFAPIFAAQFFPSKVAFVAILLTFATFAVGFFMRPIGGAVLGDFGDRRGRRDALALQILIMAVASLIIGIVPGYGTIGILAPIILVLCRLGQGFSAGGEFGGSSAFLVEYASPKRRGYIGSWQQFSVGLGTVIASALAALITGSMAHSALYGWGWRIPFLLGACIGFFGLYLRRRVNETPVFHDVEVRHATSRAPFFEMFRRHPRDFFRVFGMTIAGTLTYYIWLLYMPTFVSQTTGMPLSEALRANTIALIIFIIVIPFIGSLSDRIGRRPPLLAFALGFLILPIPLFLWLHAGTFVVVFLVELIGVLLITGYSGVTATTMAEQFPTTVRNTGIAVPYALAVAIFGGTAPFVTEYLVSLHASFDVTFYVMASAVVSGLVYLLMKETYKAPLA